MQGARFPEPSKWWGCQQSGIEGHCLKAENPRVVAAGFAVSGKVAGCSRAVPAGLQCKLDIWNVIEFSMGPSIHLVFKMLTRHAVEKKT